MSERKTGGPAFPGFIEVYDTQTFPKMKRQDHPGMSLRDYFAGQALAGICTHIQPSIGPRMDTEKLYEACATYAYGIANAMIAEREKP